MDRVAIRLDNITVERSGHTALKNISCEILENTFSIVFGPNGAGKSTLLQTIVNELQPTTGTISIFNRSPGDARQLVGYVPQIFSVRKDFPLSVFDAVSMGILAPLGILGFWKSEYSIRANEALERLSLSELKDSQIRELSGGQLQRVIIARTLVANPKILLLDEASSGIDVGAKETLIELLVTLKKDMTIVFVTHDISVVSKDVDSILCLNRELVSHGAPDKALSDEAIKCMYGDGVALFSHCHHPHIHVPEHS